MGYGQMQKARMCLFKPAPLQAGYFARTKLKFAEFKSFDRLPKIFGFGACILIAFLMERVNRLECY
jgi:hypothetical protein